jgi:hypothetical protein
MIELKQLENKAIRPYKWLAIWLYINLGTYIFYRILKWLLGVMYTNIQIDELYVFFFCLAIISILNAMAALKSKKIIRIVFLMSSIATIMLGYFLGILGVAPVVLHFRSFIDIFI